MFVAKYTGSVRHLGNNLIVFGFPELAFGQDSGFSGLGVN